MRMFFAALYAKISMLTRYSQWGNMLTLQAAYRDPVLKEYVDAVELKDLLEKTLSMLKLVAQPTSALAIDYRILKHTGLGLGLIGKGPNMTNSFSSSTPTDTAMGGR